MAIHCISRAGQVKPSAFRLLHQYLAACSGQRALVVLAIPLARVAISFGPSEYFALAILGLTLICSLGGKNVFKGILAGIFGVFLATVGFDPIAGIPRFTLGIPSPGRWF